MTLFHSTVGLADAYLQLSVPGFEYPRDIPRSVHFVGTPPIIPGQAPLPPWADELDGSRKVVLVTQGTVANHNFELLIAPTLAALAKRARRACRRHDGRTPGRGHSLRRPDQRTGRELSAVRMVAAPRGRPRHQWRLRQRQPGHELGIPLVTAGMTEDKADVNTRVAWSGVGLKLTTNEPTQEALRAAVRTALDRPAYRMRASQMADEFARIDSRSEILSIIKQVVADQKAALRAGTMAASQPRRAARHR
jgi:hypothetical protein